MDRNEARDEPNISRRRAEQREQLPDVVTPRATGDTTAELGGEGGSYGDLTQSVRSQKESAGGRQATWSFVTVALLALIIVVAVFVAMFFWMPSGKS